MPKSLRPRATAEKTGVFNVRNTLNIETCGGQRFNRTVVMADDLLYLEEEYGVILDQEIKSPQITHNLPIQKELLRSFAGSVTFFL